MRVEAEEARAGAPPEAGPAATVLLVDDDGDHRLLARRRLERTGLVVREVATGEEALERLDGVDLVLCDYRLPGMDGLAVLTAIRARGGPSVLMATGQGSERVAMEALRAGALDYVVKDAGYLAVLPDVVERAWRAHDERVRAEEVQRLALLVASTTEREALLAAIVSGARRLLRGTCAMLYLGGPDELVLECADGSPPAEPAPVAAVARRSVVDGAVRVGAGALVVPLPGVTGAVGALAVLLERPATRPASDVPLASTFASFAGIAVANSNRLAERQAALERLEVSERRFRQAFLHAPIGMALVSLEPAHLGRVLDANAEMRSLMATEPSAQVDLQAVVHRDQAQQIGDLLLALARGDSEAVTVEERFLRHDGVSLWVRATGATVSDASGTPLYAVVQVEDVSARREAEERLKELALHDALTGLPNRALLLDRLTHALARRERSHGEVALLFVDLDRFKEVNDLHGHHAGDQLLVEVARRMSAVLRPSDTAARLAGDEFVVLCEDLEAEQQAVDMALRLAGVFAEPFLVDAGAIAASASVGVCLATGLHTPEALLRDADAAMYRAKGTDRPVAPARRRGALPAAIAFS